MLLLNGYNMYLIVSGNLNYVKADDSRVDLSIKPTPVRFTFISLTSGQKCLAVAIICFALLAVAFGAASLAGAHVVMPEISWSMISAGAAVTVSVLTLLAVNHILFIKKIKALLDSGSFHWTQPSLYPCNEKWSENSDLTQGQFSLATPAGQIYGRRYAQSFFSDVLFFIEFHRTEVIHQQRTP